MRPSLSLALVVCGPLVVSLAACDALKSLAGGGDAGSDAAAAATAAPPAVSGSPAAPATAAGTVPAAPETAAPLAPGAAPGTPARVAVDAGKVGDAGALDAGPADAGADAGKGFPTPIPTLTVPTIPVFDAGGWKPPPGFPSTLPSSLPGFPPPNKK